MASDTTKNLGMYADAVDNRGYAAHVNAKDMVLLTNKSGDSVATGDVVVQVMTTNSAFTTSTTDKDARPVFVVPANISGNNVSATKTIANDEAGWVYKPGAYVPAVAVSATVSRGEYLKVGTTAKKLTGTGKIAGTDDRPAEACAVALEAVTGAGSIPALLLDQVNSRIKVAVLADQKAQNTGGGTFTSGAWRTRDLNTEISDADGLAAINSNRFTPVAGTYYIHATAPAVHTVYGIVKARLYNYTQSASVIQGTNSQTANTQAGYISAISVVEGVFTANGTDEYVIEHYASYSAGTMTYGVAINLSGINETYLSITLMKIG